MGTNNKSLAHATNSTNLADLLERVLDKGVVVAGDIKIKLVEIELLTIQIRLVICSVERAMQMGMDWWQRDPNLSSLAAPSQVPVEAQPVADAAPPAPPELMAAMEQRLSGLEETLRRMEARLAATAADATVEPGRSR